MQTRKIIGACAFVVVLLLIAYLGLAMFVFIPFDKVVEGSKTNERTVIGMLLAICVIVEGFLVRFLHRRKSR